MPKTPDDRRRSRDDETNAKTTVHVPDSKKKKAAAPEKASRRPEPPPPPPRRSSPPPPPPPRVPPQRAAPKPPPGKPHRPQPAFPKKNQPPTPAAFAARLPLALGKRFDLVRSFLLKSDGVKEDVYFYGPESGWALRYLQAGRPLCSLHIYDEQPIGILSLDPAAAAGIDWRGLSPQGQRARKQAHGSPSLLWLDVPLEATGASDFRTILRAKLASLESAEDAGDQRGSDGSDEDDE